MGSSLFAEVRRRSRAEGRVEGEARAARTMCLRFAKQHHTELLPLVARVIEACSNPALLQEWALAAPRLSDDEFLKLVRDQESARQPQAPASQAVRRRAPQPSRHSGPSKRG